MAALLSLGLVATTDAYAVKGNQTYASGTMADVQSVMQTAKKLTGKVVDAKGESIIGATIKVKGTGQGLFLILMETLAYLLTQLPLQ